MKTPIIVNLFGGPGSGKSTTAAGVFNKLKLAGVNCEIVTEFAKHITWKKDLNTLKNQIYVFAKQHDRMFHLKEQVDVIITDSPIIMGLIYTDYDKVSPSFEQLVVDEFNRPEAENLNIFIKRVKPYNPSGRSQSEEEAKEKDQDIINLFNKYQINASFVNGDEDADSIISREVLKMLGQVDKEKIETITVPMTREALLELTQFGKDESIQFLSHIHKIPVNNIISVNVLQEAGVQPMVHIEYKCES
jgi:adenylate kinase family enzyme